MQFCTHVKKQAKDAALLHGCDYLQAWAYFCSSGPWILKFYSCCMCGTLIFMSLVALEIASKLGETTWLEQF